MKIGINAFFILLLCIPLFPTPGSPEQTKEIFIREDFNNLDAWKPLHFPKIAKHTMYTIEARDHESYLKAESAASASALTYQREFNVQEYPNIRWQWKIEHVYDKAISGTKEGDDYPIRVYVTFKYDPDTAGFFDKIKYGSAKLLYGEYPPHSALNYVWANQENEERIRTSPYTEKAKLVILQQGDAHAGKWQKETVNIIRDYREAFREDPPPVASIAIMNDSDNTGESSVSYMDFIEIYR